MESTTKNNYISTKYKSYILRQIYEHYKFKLYSDLKCMQLFILTDLFYAYQYRKWLFIHEGDVCNYEKILLDLNNCFIKTNLESIDSCLIDPQFIALVKITNYEFGILSSMELEVLLKDIFFQLISFEISKLDNVLEDYVLKKFVAQ